MFLSAAPDSPELDPPFIPRDYDYPLFAPLYLESSKATQYQSNTSDSGVSSSLEGTSNSDCHSGSGRDMSSGCESSSAASSSSVHTIDNSDSSGGDTDSDSASSTRVVITPPYGPYETHEEMMRRMVSVFSL